jgi:hypothetical protein
MCIAAMGAIGAIAGLAGTVVQAAGIQQQAESRAQAAEYKAKQDRLLAEDAIARGAQEEEKHRYEVSALQGRQRAVQAAGNLDLGSGSPLAIIADTAQFGEWDAQIIRDNANREKQTLMTQASLGDMEAENSREAGSIGAFGTILGGVGTLAKTWYKT